MKMGESSYLPKPRLNLPTGWYSRRILSTYFLNPVLASLALVTAVAQSSRSIAWINNLDSRPREQEEDEKQDSDGGWADNSKPLGGQAVIQIHRNGLRFIAPVSRSGRLLTGPLCDETEHDR